jgi:hypothetical protein
VSSSMTGTALTWNAFAGPNSRGVVNPPGAKSEAAMPLHRVAHAIPQQAASRRNRRHTRVASVSSRLRTALCTSGTSSHHRLSQSCRGSRPRLA